MSNEAKRAKSLCKLADKVAELQALMMSASFTKKELSNEITDVKAVVEILEDAHYKFVGSLVDENRKRNLREELFKALDLMDAVVEPAEDMLDSMEDESPKPAEDKLENTVADNNK